MSENCINASIKARLGKKRPKELIEKIKQTKRNKLDYKIYQYDLNNIFLKEWNSLIEIQENLGYKTSNIHNCLTKKSKTSNEYKWKKISK